MFGFQGQCKMALQCPQRRHHIGIHWGMFYLPSRWTGAGRSPCLYCSPRGIATDRPYRGPFAPNSIGGSWAYGPCTRLDRLCLASTINQSLDITRAWNGLDQGLNNLSTTLRFSRVLGQRWPGISLHIEGLSSYVMGATRRWKGFRRGWYGHGANGGLWAGLQ